MWIFDRKRGMFFSDLPMAPVWDAYSGHGAGLNNPDMEQVHNVGPIPAGMWRLDYVGVDGHLGALVFHVLPQDGTETFGRSGFCIHGDNPLGNHSASDGCIILAHEYRQLICDSTDRVLQVM